MGVELIITVRSLHNNNKRFLSGNRRRQKYLLISSFQTDNDNGPPHFTLSVKRHTRTAEISYPSPFVCIL